MISVFIVFSVVLILSSLLLVFQKNLVRAVFSYFSVLFCLAAFFVLNGSDYLALVQIMIGIGGVLVVLLLGVMLTKNYNFSFPLSESHYFFPAILICLALGYLIFNEFPSEWLKLPENLKFLSLKVLGFQLLTEHLIAFELLSILLLIALIGASSIVRKN
jgi:NADH-quinone oxidoreductase subunit J